MTKTRWAPWLVAGALGLAALAPRAAAAQVSDRGAARWAHEPAAAELVRESLRYFQVHPEALGALRASSRLRALMPILSGGYRFEQQRFARFEQQMPTPVNIDENTSQNFHSVSGGAVWDLREAVFNPGEVQVYGLIAIQRDLMLEVTRAYYSRRQLQLRMAYRPPEDPIARESLQLRIDEFTALLDVLSGGWFSRTSRIRAARGGE